MTAKEISKTTIQLPKVVPVYEVTCDGICGEVKTLVNKTDPDDWHFVREYVGTLHYCPECWLIREKEEVRLEPKRLKLYSLAEEILDEFYNDDHEYSEDQHTIPYDYNRLVILLDTISRLMEDYPREQTPDCSQPDH